MREGPQCAMWRSEMDVTKGCGAVMCVLCRKNLKETQSWKAFIPLVHDSAVTTASRHGRVAPSSRDVHSLWEV